MQMEEDMMENDYMDIEIKYLYKKNYINISRIY